MDHSILSIRNLSKKYGRIRAVDELSLEIPRGSVYGILGPNGSGKTTTLGLVLSVINPSAGSFSWFNGIPSKADRKRIGAILEVPVFYPYLSGEKNLKIIASIKGCSYDKIPELLEMVKLTERKKSRFRTYSLGMKQRLAIAAALLGNTEVLILDEPTNGLDPQGIAEIREIILRIAAEGMTIILASHLLDEVQKTCTHVAVLNKGKNIFTGKVEEMINASSHVEIMAVDEEGLEKGLKENPHVISYAKEGNQWMAKLREGYGSSELNQYFISRKVVLSHINMKKKNLEKYFLEILEKK
jgi:ABC-2 type transport system ATP-binding protein